MVPSKVVVTVLRRVIFHEVAAAITWEILSLQGVVELLVETALDKVAVVSNRS